MKRQGEKFTYKHAFQVIGFVFLSTQIAVIICAALAWLILGCSDRFAAEVFRQGHFLMLAGMYANFFAVPLTIWMLIKLGKKIRSMLPEIKEGVGSLRARVSASWEEDDPK